ncbi:M81 family metallopeptidase [Pelagibius litoralis]|uniref:Microcystinase C n=1 Tax=Pelagibius litoralis TaxID=374515 RepID=A0A967KAS2_9PROT|nr:M81 family metallopeptidase [Pelagibius litoralis]NIA70647.1 M81 family metallopeptidase [Pelagibius litoralis]
MLQETTKTFRVAVGGFALESVSFLPQETGVEAFEREARRGADLIEALGGTATVAGGFLALLAEAGAEAVPLVYSDCSAAGPASDAAFEEFGDEILRGLSAAEPLDGVLLFLHGAMTTPARTDPEGDLLQSVRALLGPSLPIMVAFDLHANLSPRTAELCDALFGFHFSPHIDMAETGKRAARCLMARLKGEEDPQLAMVKVPMMLPSIFTATALAPLSDIVAESLSLPQRVPGVIDASVFCGFAYADTPDIGFSVAVVADGDQALAAQEAARLAELTWQSRDALLHDELVLGLEDGLVEARRIAVRSDRPVVVLEHADRLNDSTWCLRSLIDGPSGMAVHCPYLWDPDSAAAAVAAGAGARLNLALGGRSSERAGGSIAVEAEVLWAGQKVFTGSGPMRRGRRINLGPAALLRIGDVTVSVISNSTTAIDLDALEQFGVDFTAQDILLLRSKTHFRAVFEPLAVAIVIVDTPDWGTADLARLPYRHAPAGLFPLDRAAQKSRSRAETRTQEKQAQ